jgi:hypothetical protein
MKVEQKTYIEKPKAQDSSYIPKKFIFLVITVTACMLGIYFYDLGTAPVKPMPVLIKETDAIDIYFHENKKLLEVRGQGQTPGVRYQFLMAKGTNSNEFIIVAEAVSGEGGVVSFWINPLQFPMDIYNVFHIRPKP